MVRAAQEASVPVVMLKSWPSNVSKTQPAEAAADTRLYGSAGPAVAQDLFNDVSRYVGEPEIPPRVAIGQPFMVQAELM
jgi:hypothetical protein